MAPTQQFSGRTCVIFRKMNKRALFFLATIVAFFCLFSPTRSAQRSEKEPTGSERSESTRGERSESIELLNADLTELRMEKDNVMLNLIGNVKFKHGEVNLESERAVWYRTAGQVVFIDDVKVEDPDQILSADRVTYNKNSRKVIADGDVRLLSKKEDAMISGGHGEYDRTTKFVTFSQSPTLILKPNRGDSTVTVTSQIMEYYVDQKRAIAKKDVVITKGTMRAKCDSATLLNKENMIILEGRPEAEKERDRLSGERMEIFLQDEKMERIEIFGNAKASHLEVSDSTSQLTSYESQIRAEGKESFLSSKKMVFLLEDEELKEVEASGNATSIYYPSQKGRSDSVESLSGDKNSASGDTINLFLSDDRIRRVLIKGGALGTYSFPSEGFAFGGKEKTQDSLSSGGSVEDTIKYSADEIDYLIEKNLITLKGGSSLEYDQILLTAGKIYYHTEKEILVAEAMKKSSGETDSTKDQVWLEPPVLKDGKDEIKGKRMTYDLNSKRGKVETGVTQIERGTYHGDKLRKITEKVLLADKGSYTTCDKDKPHFHFYSRRMKIIAKDKVIAKPVVLYIADLPVAAIPFYVFPIKPGRHSGFLTFDIGNLEAGERFIRNLGYYWAASDYWDLKTAFDYYEGSGWLVKSRVRYAVRYLLDGSISGSYNRESGWNTYTYTKWRRNRWDLVINHRQTITPSVSFSAYGKFLSDKDFWRDLNLDPYERRNRSLRSQMNLNKRWANTSLTLALDQTVNLDIDDRSALLPTLRLSRSTLPLFPAKDKEKGEISKKWYNSIYYSLSSNFVNYNYKKERTGYFDRKKYMVSDNFLNLSAPQKLFGYLVLNPQFGYQETWYYIFKTNMSDDFPILGNSSARRGTYSTSLSARTTVYGTFHTKIGKLTGIRHVITPNLSFAWRPEFDRKEKYRNYTGRGGGGAKQKAMNFSLSNLFQIKTKSISDGKEVEKKLDLFTLNFSSAYNFLAKERKLSNLSTALRSSAIRNVDLSFSATHDFYDKKTGKLKLLSPRWVYFSFDTRLSFHGSWQESRPKIGKESEGLTPPEENMEGPSEKVTQTWSVNISHRFSKTRGGSKNHWASASLRLPLTRHWLLSYLNRYDFAEKKITEQTFELYRDMHCWEGRFTWIVNGYRQGYYFRINIKALPEIKIEKSRKGIREIFF
jgi:lipopolysaccharide assembly outer membrane protein LptD (OstA)